MTREEYLFSWYGETNGDLQTDQVAARLSKAFGIPMDNVHEVIANPDVYFEKKLTSFELLEYEALFNKCGAKYYVKRKEQAEVSDKDCQSISEDTESEGHQESLKLYKYSVILFIVGAIISKYLDAIDIDGSIVPYLPGYLALALGNFTFANAKGHGSVVQATSILGFIGLGLILMIPTQKHPKTDTKLWLSGAASFLAGIYLVSTAFYSSHLTNEYVNKPNPPYWDRFAYPSDKLLSNQHDYERLKIHLKDRIESGVNLLPDIQSSATDTKKVAKSIISEYGEYIQILNYQAYLYAKNQKVDDTLTAPEFLSNRNVDRDSREIFRLIKTSGGQLKNNNFSKALTHEVGKYELSTLDSITFQEVEISDADDFNHVSFKLRSGLNELKMRAVSDQVMKRATPSTNRRNRHSKPQIPSLNVEEIDLLAAAGLREGRYKNWRVTQNGAFFVFTLPKKFRGKEAVYVAHPWPDTGSYTRNSDYIHFSRISGDLPYNLFFNGGDFDIFYSKEIH